MSWIQLVVRQISWSDLVTLNKLRMSDHKVSFQAGWSRQQTGIRGFCGLKLKLCLEFREVREQDFQSHVENH